MAAQRPGERNPDSGIKLVLEELRDLRLEMRADRQHADEERRQAEERGLRADEEWRRDRLRVDEQLRRERLASDERFQQALHEFREDSGRRELVTQKAFKEVRVVGLSIVKTLNHHTRILERIERLLRAPGNGRRGRDDGRGR